MKSRITHLDALIKQIRTDLECMKRYAERSWLCESITYCELRVRNTLYRFRRGAPRRRVLVHAGTGRHRRFLGAVRQCASFQDLGREISRLHLAESFNMVSYFTFLSPGESSPSPPLSHRFILRNLKVRSVTNRNEDPAVFGLQSVSSDSDSDSNDDEAKYPDEEVLTFQGVSSGSDDDDDDEAKYAYGEQGSDDMQVDSDTDLTHPVHGDSTHKPTKAARDTNNQNHPRKAHIRLGIRGGRDVGTQQGCILFFQCRTTSLGGRGSQRA
ncbi:hypothetical protein OG21DRAFT_926198 [Imleria badia]|jgi:hypothetical protein|nr:hypothetical protein OG21DRAFT_926198 [Imleria badia]